MHTHIGAYIKYVVDFEEGASVGTCVEESSQIMLEIM